MEQCHAFHRCNQNLCPLDYNLKYRKPRGEGKCRWMINHKNEGQKIEYTVLQENEIPKKVVRVRKNPTMPAGLLNYVPHGNASYLNTPSKEAWLKINNNL